MHTRDLNNARKAVFLGVLWWYAGFIYNKMLLLM